MFKSTIDRIKSIRWQESVIWNLFLLCMGSIFFTMGAQAIIAPHGFLTGGIYGTGIFIWYATGLLSPAIWYGIISVPLFIFAYFHVSRRFFLYTLFAAVTAMIFGQWINFEIPVENHFYAAVLAGVLCGAGTGMQLRTMGSGGVLDAIGVIVNKKWNISIGSFFFSFNAILFLIAGTRLSLDMVIVSFIQIFIASVVVEKVLRMFSQRKLVYIVTDHGEELIEYLIASGYRGATVLRGKGAYSGDSKEIILTVTNNILVRNLEAMVYQIDKHALFIVESTFYVSGARYPRKEVI